MAPDLSGGLGNSKSKHVLKKGPWTTSEDVILVEYVKKHGEGNWNAVQRNSGLMRCGKSCRLRWANHLRPNLKKGAFGPEEEKLIIDLHAKLGNKWARMAAQLPGRTDNEIKNYWNTRLKRRQRAGLPIYPQQTLQQHQRQQHHQPNSSSPSLSSRLASSRPSNTNALTFYDAFASRPLISPPQNRLKLYGGNTGGGALLFSSNPFFNQGIPSPLPMPSMLQYNALDYGIKTGGSGMGVLGLPSIQSSVVTTAASSSDFAMGPASSDCVEDYEYEVELSVGGYGKSGLLEDLLGESRALACHDKTEDQAFQGTITPASEEGNNAMDDDLLDLLDNFPLSVPIPDWDEVHGSEPPRLTEGTTQSQPNSARYNPVANSAVAANQDYWSFDSCLWNNMPSIY